MPALPVAYVLPSPSNEDSIDELVAKLVPDRRLLCTTDPDLLVVAAQSYQVVLMRLDHDSDLPSLIDLAAQLVASGCPTLLLIPPEAEIHMAAAMQAGVDEYLLATPLQLQRLPRLIARAAETAHMAALLAQINTSSRSAVEQQQRQQQRQQALSAVGKALADISLNEASALEQAAYHVTELVGDACAILLIQPDQQQYEIAALYHPDPAIALLSRDLFGKLSYTFDQTILAELLAHQHPLILNREQIAQLPEAYQTPHGYQDSIALESLMMAPLRTRRELIGVLIAIGNQPNRQYSQDDQAFFQEIAEWTALSISNLRLFQAAQHELAARQSAEGALLESNERYNLAVQGSSDGLWDWNLHTDVAYLSPRFRELIGYGSESYRGGISVLNDVIHPEDSARVLAAIIAHLRERTLFHGEYRLHTASAGYRWFLIRGQALWDAEGRPTRMAGSLTDIHDAKQAQEQLEDLNRTLEQRIADRTAQLEQTLQDLRDNERRLRTLVAHAPIILFSLDRNGIFTFSEGHGLTAMGFTSKQAVGRSVFEIYYDRPDVLADIRKALAGERLMTIREVGERVFETWYTPLVDQDGRVSGTIGVSADVSARQQAEREIRERSEELVRVNSELARAARLKDEFLANMSHELRTPLTSILGRSELLQEDPTGALSAFQLRSVRSIEESGHHLLRLINDILDLSKIEAGKINLVVQPVLVADLCSASIRMLHEAALKRRLKVHTAIDPTVATIAADERRLKQILVNLLSNAVKFTPPGQSIGLEVHGDPVKQEAHFTVWDTGIGIAVEDQARLFQPFMQIDSSMTRQYEGTGLGLVLVAHLTAMHHGRVTLESAPEQGSRFTVTLPWVLAAPYNQ